MKTNEYKELTIKLYECSMLMENFDKEASDMLLELSANILNMYEISKIPPEIRGEIDDIKSELLSDD